MFDFFKKKKQVAKANYIGSTMQEGINIINSGEDIVIVDVRTKEEYLEGHIKGSISIPVDDIENLADKCISRKDKKVLVYSKVGKRSQKASAKLAIQGYINVIDIGKLEEYTGEIEK